MPITDLPLERIVVEQGNNTSEFSTDEPIFLVVEMTGPGGNTHSRRVQIQPSHGPKSIGRVLKNMGEELMGME